MRRLSLLLLAAILFGCALGPDYGRPDLNPPAQWYTEGTDSGTFRSDGWWKLFEDPTLDRLVEAALLGNRDLKIARARIEQARAGLRIVGSNQYPVIDAKGSARRSAVMAAPGRDSVIGEDYQGVGSLSFEIDLWGRLRRLSEAARADLLASEFGREVTRLVLIGDVAYGYFNLRTLDLQLNIAEETLKGRAEQFGLQEKRFRGGIVSELDVRQAEADYKSAAATIPGMQDQIAAQEHALAVLLGRYPEEIERGKGLPGLTIPPAVPVGLPSQLLERRPDVLRAEQNLIAANASIGAAKAAYFPSISLTGIFGSESDALRTLFGVSSRIWQVNAAVTQSVFNAGKTGARVRQAKAQQEESLQIYFKTVENAFREVEDALVRNRTTREQYTLQADRIKALERSLALATTRYKNGYTVYLDVLDAERNLFTARLLLAQTRQAQLNATVTLYKALGGGWER